MVVEILKLRGKSMNARRFWIGMVVILGSCLVAAGASNAQKPQQSAEKKKQESKPAAAKGALKSSATIGLRTDYKCDSKESTCKCSGTADCFEMGRDGVCESNTIVCDKKVCICTWKRSRNQGVTPGTTTRRP